MKEDLYVEKLAWFKQNERPEVVLLLADNPDLVKIVVAWTSLDIKRADKLSGLSSESESEAWEWLWHNTNYRLGELKEKIGAAWMTTAVPEFARENADLLAALTSLGYSAAEAMKAIATIPADANLTLEEKIKSALQYFGGK